MEYDYVDLRGQWAGANVSVTYWGAGTLNCYLIPSEKYPDLVGGKEIDCDEFSVTQGTSVVQLPGPGYLILDGIGEAQVTVRPGVSASDYVSVDLHRDPGYDLNVGGAAPSLNQLPFTAPSGPYDLGERDLTTPFNPDFQYVDSSPLISQLNAMNAAAAAGPQQEVEQLATRYAQLQSQLDAEGNKSERERSQTSGGSLSASMLRPQLQEVQHQLNAAIAKLAAIPDYSSGQIGSLTVRKGGDPSKQVSFNYTDADGRRGAAEIRTLPDGRLSVIDGGRESTYKDGNFQGTTGIPGTEAPGTFFEMSRADLIGTIAASMIPIPGTGWVLKILGKAGERAIPWLRKLFKRHPSPTAPEVPAFVPIKAPAGVTFTHKKHPYLGSDGKFYIPEGKSDTRIVDPSDLGREITDIDLLEKGLLIEEKTATNALDIEKWVSKQVIDKTERYLKARQYIAGYEQAPIVFRFTTPGVDASLRTGVERAVADLKIAHPNVTVRVEWPS